MNIKIRLYSMIFKTLWNILYPYVSWVSLQIVKFQISFLTFKLPLCTMFKVVKCSNNAKQPALKVHFCDYFYKCNSLILSVKICTQYTYLDDFVLWACVHCKPAYKPIIYSPKRFCSSKNYIIKPNFNRFMWTI